ncbi:MAG: PEP-CTERM sorting domain-containing protein [Rhodocyclaceae bacterium]|nr:MAG: PEP-CTERM sorting domain-containing protein [Rhodocyclaceae bacterium]
MKPNLYRMLGRLAAVLGVFLGLHGEALAETDAGLLAPTPYVYSATVMSGQFQNLIAFEMPDQSFLSASAVPLDMQAGPLNLLHIENLAYAFFDGTGQLVGSSAGGLTNFLQPLDGGTYHAAVTGTATGSSGGAYLFSLAAIPDVLLDLPPVPEPGAWALLGLGLFAMVMVVRRKGMGAPGMSVGTGC